jgi:hypothetical protein
MAGVQAPQNTDTAYHDALSFDAPYVVERLVKDRVAGSEAEAARLFDEAKKYLVLSEATRDAVVGMFSVRVDEAWHAFVLYTAEYQRFCEHYFGKFIPHAPKNAPCLGDHDLPSRPELTFAEFRTRYEDFFGEPLPDVWYDARAITTTRRVFCDAVGTHTVRRRESEVALLDDTGDVVVSANAIASGAFEFIAATDAFYIRELPGDLTDGEKIALVRALLSAGVVRMAP